MLDQSCLTILTKRRRDFFFLKAGKKYFQNSLHRCAKVLALALSPEVPFPVQELKVTGAPVRRGLRPSTASTTTTKTLAPLTTVLGTAGPVKATTSIWGGPDCLFDEQMAVEVRLTFNGGGLYLYQSTPGV